MPLPHDFRAAARLPIPVNANGAPLQVSGTKLQENFEYLDKKSQSGTTVNVLVVENGVFKTGDFLISGLLTEI